MLPRFVPPRLILGLGDEPSSCTDVGVALPCSSGDAPTLSWEGESAPGTVTTECAGWFKDVSLLGRAVYPSALVMAAAGLGETGVGPLWSLCRTQADSHRDKGTAAPRTTGKHGDAWAAWLRVIFACGGSLHCASKLLSCSLEHGCQGGLTRPLRGEAESGTKPRHRGTEHGTGWLSSVLSDAFLCSEGLPRLPRAVRKCHNQVGTMAAQEDSSGSAPAGDALPQGSVTRERLEVGSTSVPLGHGTVIRGQKPSMDFMQLGPSPCEQQSISATALLPRATRRRRTVRPLQCWGDWVPSCLL